MREVINMLEEINVLREKLDEQVLKNAPYEDILFTKALVEIGLIPKIPIIDHIIVSNNNYYSFNDNGKISTR